MTSKQALCVTVIILALTGVADAGISEWFYGRSWNFIESVGGISVDIPTRDQNGIVRLPVTCDVSGLTTVTKKPTAINSALVVTGISKKIEGYEIMISVDTGLISGNSKSCTCSAVFLGDIPAGDYEVVYYGADREKHSLGRVTVLPK